MVFSLINYNSIVTSSLTFLKGVLPSYAFYGRNNQGPEICITDDSSAKQVALKMVWPTPHTYCAYFIIYNLGGHG